MCFLLLEVCTVSSMRRYAGTSASQRHAGLALRACILRYAASTASLTSLTCLIVHQMTSSLPEIRKRPIGWRVLPMISSVLPVVKSHFPRLIRKHLVAPVIF